MFTQSQQTVKVWDPLIRIFHWSLATCFLLNFFLLEEGESAHEWVGYLTLALVAVRVVWGFIGPQNARFSDFWPTPARIKHHLCELLHGGTPSPDRHNPIGGLMILALLAGVVVTGLSGWLATTDLFWGEDWIEDLHETSANLVMGLVGFHVVAVVWFSRRGPHNLIRIMLTGYRDK